jgi:archaellum component FlaG (FlaF/FlaG flagellin family)
MHAGKLCLVIKNLTQEDGVTSTTNAWDVLLEGRILRVHKLDLESIDKND